MKALYLEPDEEITSVIDRLRVIDDSEIAIVVPKRASLLQSIINLKLLKAQAEQQDKKISVVTTDKTGRNLASAVGLTVYQRLPEGTEGRESAVKEAGEPVPIKFKRQAPPPTDETPPAINFKQMKDDQPEVETHDLPEPEPPTPESVEPTAAPEAVKEPKPDKKSRFSKPKVPKPKVPKLRLRLRTKKIGGIWVAAAILAVVVGVGTVAAMALPKAVVQVTPKTDALTVDVPMTFSARQPGPDAEGNVMPAKVIEVTQQSSKEVTATGTQSGGDKARGDVAVINTLNRNQSLVARTRFAAPNGRIFRTERAVVVPAAGQATVTVIADDGGEDGNLPAGTRLTIPGLGGSEAVYGQVGANFTGGSPGQGATEVSAADVDKARSELAKQAAQEGLAQAKEKLAVGYKLNEQVVATTVLSSSTNPRVGASAAKFTITGTVKVAYFTYQEEELQKIITGDLSGKVPAGTDLVEESTVQTFVIGQTSADRLVGTIKISTNVAPDVTREQIKQDIAGKTPTEAAEALRSTGRANDVQVKLSPFWVRKIPDNPGKIEIQYLTGTPSASPSPGVITPVPAGGSPPPVL